MSDLAIEVKGIGKKYRIGGQEASYRTIREAVVNAAGAPIRRAGEILRGQPPSANGHDEIWALKDVSFEVNRGEVVGIIGPNGAGKSTLLKILSRITKPTEGHARVYGRVGSLLEVGTGFHPELTGRENVYLSGAILGMKRAEIERKFDEIVDFAGVGRFVGTPVKHFSSGMYLRLAFSVAAHLDPEILLVDEVLAVGDAKFQKKCLGKMGNVAKEGRTVLFVSHNMGAVSRLCERALWLEAGHLKCDDLAKRTISEYLSANSSLTGERRWHAAGFANANTTELRLLSVKVHDESGRTVANLSADEAFLVRITYRICRKLTHYRVGFLLKQLDGVALFETYESDDTNSLRRGVPGHYEAVCEIPGGILKPGYYWLTVNAGVPNVKNLVLAENILQIEIQDTDYAQAYVGEKRQGLIRPKLSWKHRSISDG